MPGHGHIRRDTRLRKCAGHSHAGQAPRANAITERWIGSTHRQCTDRMLIVGQDHLRRVLVNHVDQYNAHRPHRSRSRILQTVGMIQIHSATFASYGGADVVAYSCMR
ncbi:integrase core domain-containing protein [Nonomuraea jabiensis]|uniref:integrase core domain-containing protein n=1 Tax=Nonomuraea jabiensis TaxID=882448 RepID=UPI00368FBBB9